MSVIDVKTQEDFNKHTNEGMAVIDFGAEWCGPCRRIEPVFKELAAENPNIKFLHIDVDEASETLPNVLVDISSVPTFFFYKNGKLADKFSGANLNKLKEGVEKLKTETPESDGAAASSSNDEKLVKFVVTAEDYTNLISTGKAVVDFGAEWCMPCKVIKPIFESMAKDYREIKFVKVDIDKSLDHLGDILNEIEGVPTFFFYFNNNVVDRFSGANPILLKSKIERLNAMTEESLRAEENAKNNLEISAKPLDASPKKDEAN